MSWLRRRAETAVREREADVAVEGVHAAPGLQALFEDAGAPGDRTLLDLGPAAEGNLRCYRAFARRIRFADLRAMWHANGSLAGALDTLRRYREGPYDFVLAWTVLDLLAPAQRAEVIAGLAELTRPGARLHFMSDMSEDPSVRRLDFSVVDRSHVRWRQTGVPQPPLARLLPADVERVAEPFRVAHAFVLRSGMREYVAVRR